MTDAEWVVVGAGLPVPAWMDGRGGRPEGYCHRQMIDAVRYLVDNGSFRRLRLLPRTGLLCDCLACPPADLAPHCVGP
ncbi:hypothetical protein [Streptomyces sp. HC307]|uniref:hypothetical protein n=1 Tax=Streptomyces flavusporus TaxID=3385496 RepID=UPI003916E5C5